MPAAQTQATRLLELLPLLEHAVVVEHRPADQIFSAICREHREWGARDRRLFGDTLFAYFRWRGWLLGQQPATALALAGWLEGLGQQALRVLAEQAGLNLPVIAPEKLTEQANMLGVLLGREKKVEQLVPDWTLPLLAGESRRQLEAFQHRPPVWLRVAVEKIPAVVEFFNQQSPRAVVHPRVLGAIAVIPPANLQGLCAATGVTAIVQDLASQVVGLVCAPRPGERWWDVCAGAGGKTLHLAALMQNRGSLFATDIRAGALRELEKRAVEAGVTMVRTRRVEGRGTSGAGRVASGAEEATRDTRPETRDFFDGVLVDAPCSGIGTWNRNPDMRWRTGAADVTAKAATQCELLERAAQSVRPGGTLVYAVCTVTVAETTAVTEAFTRAHPEFRPDTLPHPLTGEVQGGAFWIWPWDGPCDGMFCARWRRT